MRMLSIFSLISYPVGVRNLIKERQKYLFRSLLPEKRPTRKSWSFFNDVCLWQMMKAVPMMTASPNDVCLRAHKGKHRIIASETSNIILSEAKNIMSPQAMHHYIAPISRKALQSPRFYDIITSPINKNLMGVRYA